MTQVVLGVWALLIVVLGVCRPRVLIPLCVALSVFEGAALVSAGGMPVSPYYLAVLIVAVRCVGVKVPRGTLLGRTAGVRQIMTATLAFTVLAVAGAAVLPRVFAGIPVHQPRLDAEYAAGLVPSTSNVAQAGYLVLNVLLMWFAAQQPNPAAVARGAVRGLMVGGTIVVLMGLYQFAALKTGLPYPDELLYSNDNYVMMAGTSVGDAPRICSTFTEPAGMAVFLVGLLAFLTGDVGRAAGPAGWRVPLMVGTVAVILLSTSSTAYVGLGVVGAWRVGTNVGLPLLRGRLTAKQVLLTCGGVLAVVGLIAASPELRDMLREMVLEKNQSASYEDRSAADSDSMQLSVKTLGLGVGLGSNRASAFLPSMLSTIGVWGVGLFALLIWLLVRRPAGGGATVLAWHNGLAAALLGVMAAKLLSSPDLNTSSMWSLLAALVAVHSAADVVPADVMGGAVPHFGPAAKMPAGRPWEGRLQDVEVSV